MQRTTKITVAVWLVASLWGAASITGMVGCAADDDSANLNPQPLPPGPEQPKDEERGTAGQKGSQTGGENADNAPAPAEPGASSSGFGGTSGSSGAGVTSDAGGQ